MKNLLLLLAALSAYTHADNLVFGELTYHFDGYKNTSIDKNKTCSTNKTKEQLKALNLKNEPCEEYSVVDPLVGYDFGKYTVVVLKNSFDRAAVIITRNYSHDFTSNLRSIVSVGLASGYQDKLPTYGGVAVIGYLGLDIHPSSDSFGVIFTCNSEFCGIGGRIKL